MQKINIISCCAECSTFKSQEERIPYCEKQKRRIDENSENSVNPALIGFPEWCPLETMKTDGETTDYKKEVKRIMRIMADETNPDPLAEASHYLNTVVDDARKQSEPSNRNG